MAAAVPDDVGTDRAPCPLRGEKSPRRSGESQQEPAGPFQPSRRRSWRVSAEATIRCLFLCLSLGACAAPDPDQLTPEEVEAAEEDLSREFDRPRTVLCDALAIELTPNFYDRALTLPAASDSIAVERVPQPDGGTLYTYKNLLPGSPMQFQVVEVTFYIWQRAEIRVPGGKVQARLQAAATGEVSVRDDTMPDAQFVKRPALVLGVLPGEARPLLQRESEG